MLILFGMNSFIFQANIVLSTKLFTLISYYSRDRRKTCHYKIELNNI
jgi:hypothetical protein